MNDVSGPPRLGFVIGQLDWGGSERQLYLLARELSRQGDHVSVACLSGRIDPYGLRLRREGIDLQVLQRKGSWDWSRVRDLRRWVRRNGLAAVCTFGEHTAVYTELARWPSRSRPRTSVFVRRSASSLSGMRRMLAARAARRAGSVCANSEAGVRYARERLGLSSVEIPTVRNLVPTELLQANVDRSDVRRTLGVGDDVPLVVYVGRDAPAKDIPTLCRVLAILEQGQAGFRALVVGHGLDRPPGGSGLGGGNVTWLGVREDAQRILAASDIVLLTSRSEGTPNVVLEAMALGRAVVSTDVGDVRDMLAPPGGGVVVPPGDPQAAATAVTALLKDAGRRRRLGMEARRRVEESFSAAPVVRRFRQILLGPVVADS